MTLKNEALREDGARREGEAGAPRGLWRRAWRLLVAVGVGLAVAGLSGGATRRAEAEAPPCRYTPTASTVFDKETGLSWQRTNIASYSFDVAKDHCAGLSVGGLQGWRLPTLQELLTIVDESQTQPSIDPTAFPGTPPLGFWSATPSATDPSQVWYVSFSGGYTDLHGTSSSQLVRCVR
jgi:Protein of unknown function (DUF1566)